MGPFELETEPAQPIHPITVNQVQPSTDALLASLTILMYLMALILLACAPAIVIFTYRVLL
jgi:hypothetical protein